jgi:hypothetical protein
MKKIIILPALFILTHILYIGCCKCMPDASLFKDVTSMRVFEYGDKNFFSRDSVKVIDSFIASININYNYVTKNKLNPFSALVNSAYAWSCNCGGIITDLGFKHKIDSITITSNSNFNGITSGNNLAQFFSASYASRTNGINQKVSIPQLIDSLNTVKYVDGFSLLTIGSNLTIKTHKFSYKLYSNSKVFEALGSKLVLFQ